METHHKPMKAILGQLNTQHNTSGFRVGSDGFRHVVSNDNLSRKFFYELRLFLPSRAAILGDNASQVHYWLARLPSNMKQKEELHRKPLIAQHGATSDVQRRTSTQHGARPKYRLARHWRVVSEWVPDGSPSQQCWFLYMFSKKNRWCQSWFRCVPSIAASTWARSQWNGDRGAMLIQFNAWIS